MPQAGVKTSGRKACLGWLFDEKKRGQIWVGDERLSGGAERVAEGGSSQSQDGYVYAVCSLQLPESSAADRCWRRVDSHNGSSLTLCGRGSLGLTLFGARLMRDQRSWEAMAEDLCCDPAPEEP